MIYKLKYQDIGEVGLKIVESEESSYAEIKDVLRDKPIHLHTFDKYGFVFPHIGTADLYVDSERLHIAFTCPGIRPETKKALKSYFIDRYINLI